MPKFVCQDGAALAKCQRVDEGQPDLEVLLGWKQQVDEGEIVKHRRVDLAREKHAVRPRRFGAVRQRVQEGEQPGLLARRDFQHVVERTALHEEQRLEHEHREE